MRYNASIGIARMKFGAGAVLICLASIASATTAIVGGGDTLPTVGYTGASTIQTPFTPISPVSGSLFAVYASTVGRTVTYCPVGGVAGKKILAGNDPTGFNVNAACDNTLFAMPGFGGFDLLQPHFAAADAPLAVSEFDNYVAGHGAGSQPVQLPAMVGAISVVFNKAGVTAMSLTEGQICGIFSGQIVDWADVALIGTVRRAPTARLMSSTSGMAAVRHSRS